MSNYAAYFSRLKKVFPNYSQRTGQIELSDAIATNIAKKSFLFAEAGTGTGKTLAYLLPAVIEGKKTLISTASKTLQEQIFNKDLPLARKIISSPFEAVLLKGRRNYLCLQHQQELFSTDSQSEKEKIYRKRIDKFLKITTDGDLALLKGVPENDPIINEITSTKENCAASLCPFYKECFFYQARTKAKQADIVVVNHHLLTIDLMLQSEIDKGILPNIEAYIIDEAHKFPEMITDAMTTEITFYRLQLYINALGNLADGSFKPVATDLAILANNIKSITEKESLNKQITSWDKLDAVKTVLISFKDYLKENLSKLICEEATTLQNLYLELDDNNHTEKEDIALRLNEIEHFLMRSRILLGDIETILTPPKNSAFWFEALKNGFKFNCTSIAVDEIFQSWIAKLDASWTFLSATLSVDDKLDFFAARLGVSEFSSAILPSPFDYHLQSILYHPSSLPDPNHENYTIELMKAVLPILTITGGRAFLLFTSYAAMNRAKDFFDQQTHDFHLLVQGEMGKVEILEKFRTTKRAVLLATASFWEGVDVSGAALVCVVIDKLPFESPIDAIVKSRHEIYKQQGRNPFVEDSLPRAIVTLKQGVGRLIRDVKDYGILVIGDPRLTSKYYGKQILNNLPPMTKIQQLERVERFFKYHENNTSH